ncbi:lytic transglycosylase domain-containing protein [Magnetococcales bacterium HHB-1]
MKFNRADQDYNQHFSHTSLSLADSYTPKSRRNKMAGMLIGIGVLVALVSLSGISLSQTDNSTDDRVVEEIRQRNHRIDSLISWIGTGLFPDDPEKKTRKILLDPSPLYASDTTPETRTPPSALLERQDPTPPIPNVIRRNRTKNQARTPESYRSDITRAAREVGLDAALIGAIIRVESNFNPNAVSPRGAMGLMQLMPATARIYGVTDRRDPKANLHAGTRHFRGLMRKFNNNVRLALAAYNAGEYAVKKYGNRVPPYRETQKYVIKVLAYQKKYQAHYN